MRLLVLKPAGLIGVVVSVFAAGFFAGVLVDTAHRDAEIERAKALVQRCAEQFPTREQLGSQRPLTR